MSMVAVTEAMRVFAGMMALTAVFLVAAGILVICNRSVDRKARIAFIAVIAGLFCIVIADTYMAMTNGARPELRVVHTLLETITFILAPAIAVVIAQTIFPDRSVRWMMGLVIVHALFQLGNIFGGYVFYVDESNVYHRGFLYPVYMAAYSISALYLFVESIRAGRVYQCVNIATLFGILACMLTGVLIQVIDPAVRTTWPAVSMAVVLYFLFYSDMVTRADPLTKLLNRRSYDEALARLPQKCVVVVIDVDNFKNVNDSYGHAFGDYVLERVGLAIRRAFGAAGQCFRTGGDEFAVIVTKGFEAVPAMAEDLREQGVKAQAADSRMPSLSVGYATVDEEHPDFDAAFEAADAAMYERKRSDGHHSQSR